jgi:hypothetical protein
MEKTIEERLEIRDRKLELNILNSEIRSVVKSLESTALTYESKINQYEKNVDNLNNFKDNLPKILTLNEEELDQLIGDTMEDMIKLKFKVSNDIEIKKKERQTLTSEIRRQQEKIIHYLDEKGLMNDAADRARRGLLSEQARIDVLLSQQSKLRDLISEFNNGKWETEAFISITGSKDGRLEVQDIPKALSPWIPPDSLTAYRELPQSTLNQMYGEFVESIDLNSFFRLCDVIMSVNSNDDFDNNINNNNNNE